MSERKQSSDVEAAALTDSPFMDDAERAESEWLLAQETGPNTPAPSSRISSDYAELEDLLATLPTEGSDNSWHDRVLKAAASSTSPSRPRWRRGTVAMWVMGGAFVAAAAAVVWH